MAPMPEISKNRRQPLETNTAKRLRTYYLIALVLIAALTVVAHMKTQNALRELEGNARVINVAGRQRMLSQRIAKDALALFSGARQDKVERYADELQQTLGLWSRNHEALQRGDHQLRLLPTNDADILRKFDDLEPHFHAIKVATQGLIERARKSLLDAPDRPGMAGDVAAILAHEDDFLAGMEQIVSSYEALPVEAAGIKRADVVLMFLILAALVCVGLVVFEPAVRLIRRQISDLEQAKEVAETAESRLQENLDELSLHKVALDHSIIVSETDARGRITHANDPFCLASRYSREELIGQDHRIVNSGHHPKSFFADMWGTIARGEVWRGEIKNRAKDGSHYWVDTTIVPHVGADGQAEGYLALRVLITDRKDAEEDLEAKTEELERSNAELAQFAYVASHNLQEPLRMVTSYVQLLGKRYKGQLDSEAEEFIGYAVDGANRMKQLISDLLQYSRVGTTGGELSLIQCETALEVTLRNLQASIEETGAEITHDTLPAVEADGRYTPNKLADGIDRRGKPLLDRRLARSR